MKRYLYFTKKRYRYAYAPELAQAAVYFKSGSHYRCEPEPGYACGKYRGNAHNLMNSVAIVESPAAPGPGRKRYLVALMSNVLRKNSPNRLTRWLSELGLMGCRAQHKFLPAVVFQCPRHEVAILLNRLFATDGWATVLRTGQSQLGFASVSRRLAQQVQHLLLRFGVIAILKRRLIRYGETRREAWQLDITDAGSIRTFIAEIGIFGKEAALERVRLLGSAVSPGIAHRVFAMEADRPLAITERLLEYPLAGDFLFASKFEYGGRVPLTAWRLPGYREPGPGDVIVFRDPLEPGSPPPPSTARLQALPFRNPPRNESWPQPSG